MLDKIWALGKMNDKLTNPISLSNLGLDTNLQEANVILLQLKKDGNNWQYTGMKTIEYDPTKPSSLLFKDITRNGVSEYPTFKCGKISQELDKRITMLTTVFDKFKKCSEKNLIAELANIQQCLDTIFPTSSIDLTNAQNNSFFGEFFQKVDSKKTNLISLELNGKCIGESGIFTDFINKQNESINSRQKSYHTKYSTTSKGTNTICYLCKTLQKEVFGFASPYSFYSSNEEAYIASGFKKKNSCINFPVCSDCANYMDLGATIIKTWFTRKFYNCDYFLIPSQITGFSDNFPSAIQELIETTQNTFSLSESSQEQEQQRIASEEYILEEFANQPDQIAITLFFFSDNGKEFKILSEIEDVLPSRCGQLVAAQKDLRECELYKKNSNAFCDFSFDFGIVKNLFGPPISKKAPFPTLFLDICSKIFKGIHLNEAHMIALLIQKIRTDFKESLQTEFINLFTAYQSILFIHYCKKLNLFSTPCKEKSFMSLHTQPFFDKYPEFYDQNWKKTACLVGVYTRLLLNIQHQQSNDKSMPFRKRLNNLVIDTQILKRIYREIEAKLSQYNKNYYSKLSSDIALLFAESPDITLQSPNEISFYFVQGMQFATLCKPYINPIQEDNQ